MLSGSSLLDEDRTPAPASPPVPIGPAAPGVAGVPAAAPGCGALPPPPPPCSLPSVLLCAVRRRLPGPLSPPGASLLSVVLIKDISVASVASPPLLAGPWGVSVPLSEERALTPDSSLALVKRRAADASNGVGMPAKGAVAGVAAVAAEAEEPAAAAPPPRRDAPGPGGRGGSPGAGPRWACCALDGDSGVSPGCQRSSCSSTRSASCAAGTAQRAQAKLGITYGCTRLPPAMFAA